MNWLELVLSSIFGLGLGVFYFGGLWLTVKNMPHFKYPGFVIVGSFLLRMGVLLLAFYWLLQFHWGYLVVALITLILARLLLMNKIKEPYATTQN